MIFHSLTDSECVYISEELCRTPGAGSPNNRGSVEHWLRNTDLSHISQRKGCCTPFKYQQVIHHFKRYVLSHDLNVSTMGHSSRGWVDCYEQWDQRHRRKSCQHRRKYINTLLYTVSVIYHGNCRQAT